MNLDEWNKILDAASKVVTMLAVVIGGLWAYLKFGRERTAKWNLQVGVKADVLPYNASLRLLVVHVQLKNIGKVIIRPGAKGLLVTVRAVPAGAPQNAFINYSKAPAVAHRQVLRTRQDPPHREGFLWLKKAFWAYKLEPGEGYHEVEALIVAPGLIAVEAVFDGPDGDFVDDTCFVRVH
ncbi:MAG: hypothetical protein V4510_10480 [bacterium]